MYTRRDWRVMTIVDAAMVGMVPDGSRWFQRGPDGSRRFQMVPDGSRWFQLTVSKLTCACWDNPLETIATGLAGRFLALNIRHALPWSVRSTALFKLKIRKWTDRSNIKSVYRSTHFYFCSSISSNLASVPISSNLLK